jgi:hypothetical protein
LKWGDLINRLLLGIYFPSKNLPINNKIPSIYYNPPPSPESSPGTPAWTIPSRAPITPVRLKLGGRILRGHGRSEIRRGRSPPEFVKRESTGISLSWNRIRNRGVFWGLLPLLSPFGETVDRAGWWTCPITHIGRSLRRRLHVLLRVRRRWLLWI